MVAVLETLGVGALEDGSERRRALNRRGPDPLRLALVDPSKEPPKVLDNIEGTRIGRSTIHGWGLFAEQEIRAGTMLCALDGQAVPWKEYLAEAAGADGAHEWNALRGGLLLVRPMRTKYGMVNHAMEPNCSVEQSFGGARMFTLRAIAAGEELTLDYRREPLPKEYLAAAAYL